jgi:hypothetical protein
MYRSVHPHRKPENPLNFPIRRNRVSADIRRTARIKNEIAGDNPAP